jgi:hypothetical protein
LIAFSHFRIIHVSTLDPHHLALLTAAAQVPCLALEIRDTLPDTWVATDSLGRVLPTHEEAGSLRPNRTVGIFYFNWHAAFGNQAVHDISKLVAANPDAPTWGPVQAPHYWSEPRFGYYRPDDPWVIRKQCKCSRTLVSTS